MINWVIIGLIVFLFILMDFIVPAITPGFSQAKIDAIILYSRLLLIGQLPFLIIGNFLTGIGQANKMFFLPALGPIFYNLTIILSALVFSSKFFLLAPVFGVIIGAILFVMIQLPIFNDTLPHQILLKYKASRLLLKPAPPGTGLKVGGVVRTILDVAGVNNASGKIIGTRNQITNAYAVMEAIKRMKPRVVAQKKQEKVVEEKKVTPVVEKVVEVKKVKKVAKKS